MENKKNNGKKITIFALILSVISVGILVFGFSLVSSDKVVILQSISNLYKKVEKLPETEKEMLNKMATSDDIGIKATIDASMSDEKISAIVDYLENKSDKKAELNMSLKYDDEELINFIIAFAENKIYGFIKDITPSFYYEDYDFESMIKTISGDDSNTLSALLKDAVKESIDKNDITKEKTTITYNGKNKKVNKLTYKVTGNEVYEIITTFVKSIKSDKKLAANFAKYMNISTEELNQLFDSILNEKPTEEMLKQEFFYYNVYFYGFNKIVQYEIYVPEEKMLLQYKVEKTSNISLYQDSIQLFELKITKNKNDYSYELSAPNTLGATVIKGTYKDNTLTAEIEESGAKVVFTITSDLKKVDNNYVSTVNFKYSVSALGFSVDIASINMTTELYFNKKVDVDLSNSKNINEVTEEEINEMERNLESNKLYIMIQELIEQYAPMIEGIIGEYTQNMNMQGYYEFPLDDFMNEEF